MRPPWTPGSICEDCGGSGHVDGFAGTCTYCDAAQKNRKIKGNCRTCGFRAEPGSAQCRLCKMEDDEARAEAAAEVTLTNADAERRRRFDAHQAAARAAAAGAK